MEAIETKVEGQEINTQVAAESADKLQAVRELSSLELTLVGGGTAAVAFY